MSVQVLTKIEDTRMCERVSVCKRHREGGRDDLTHEVIW